MRSPLPACLAAAALVAAPVHAAPSAPAGPDRDTLTSFEIGFKEGADPMSEVKESLNLIMQHSADVVDKLKDIVWLTKLQHENAYDIIKRLDEYLRQVAKGKNINSSTADLNTPHTMLLSENQSRNLYLIGKEIIHNMVKHAQATDIHFEPKITNDLISLQFTDNGIGYDSDQTKQGNGITNMKRRAAEIGGVLTIKSSPGKGSEVNLSIRLK